MTAVFPVTGACESTHRALCVGACRLLLRAQPLPAIRILDERFIIRARAGERPTCARMTLTGRLSLDSAFSRRISSSGVQWNLPADRSTHRRRYWSRRSVAPS